MNGRIAIVAGTALCVGAASAQPDSEMGAAGSIVPTMRASEPGGHVGPRGPVVASLTYDGVETYGFRGFPSFGALDSKGKMLVKPRGRSIGAFEAAMKEAAE